MGTPTDRSWTGPVITCLPVCAHPLELAAFPSQLVGDGRLRRWDGPSSGARGAHERALTGGQPTLRVLAPLVTGVGKVAAAVELMRALEERPDISHVLLFGVGGAVPDRLGGGSLCVGDVGLVTRAIAVDEGVQAEHGRSDLAQLGLAPVTALRSPYVDCGGWLLEDERPWTALTTSLGSGTDESALQALSVAMRAGVSLEDAVETMESSAVAHACARLGVGLVELRAVSNFVGDRGLGQWQLKGPLEALHARLLGVAASRDAAG